MGLDVPPELAEGGRQLWLGALRRASECGVVLGPGDLVLLQEAGRAKDRLDRLHARLGELPGPGESAEVLGLYGEAVRLERSLMQLLAAVRLPGSDGRRPQRRGGARGGYRPRQG